MSQTDQILEHLKSGCNITPLGALSKFGCFRLGARIHDLRMSGYKINTTIIKRPDGKHYASYKLEN